MKRHTEQSIQESSPLFATFARRYVSASGSVRAVTGAALLAVLLVAALSVMHGVFGSAVVINASIAVVAVVALGSFMGNSGILSLGHVGFVAIGAYGSGLLTIPPQVKAEALPNLPGWLQSLELPLIPAIAVAVLLAVVVAFIVSPAITRPSGYAAAIASLGVLVIVRSALVWLEPFTRGSQTFYGIPRLTTEVIGGIAAIGAILAARLFRESDAGMRLRAARDDALAGGAFGANIPQLRLRAWLISAALAGVAGALMAHFITAFSPTQFFLALTLSYLVMLIAGGQTTVSGATFGAIAVVAIVEGLAALESGFVVGSIEVPAFFGLPQLVLSVGMILVLYALPKGAIGTHEIEETIIYRALSRSLDNQPSDESQNYGGE